MFKLEIEKVTKSTTSPGYELKVKNREL